MIKDPDCISDTVPRKTLSFSDSEKHASSPIAGEGKKNVISTLLCKRLHYKGNKEDIISSSIPETHSLGSAESASHKLPISALTNSFIYDSFYQQHQVPTHSRYQTTDQSRSSQRRATTIFTCSIPETRESPSAKLSTLTLTEDVPGMPDEPSAAVGVDSLISQASSTFSLNSFRTDHSPASKSFSDTSIHANSASSNVNRKKLWFQWNIRGLWSNHAELRQIIELNPPLTIGLQELKTNKTNHILKNLYDWNISDRNITNGAGYAGLGVLNGIPHLFLSIPTTIPICAATLGPPYNITVVSVYFPIGTPNSEIITNLNLLMKHGKPPYLIGGDFNAAHEAWGSSRSTLRGRSLLNWIVDNGMQILNDGTPTFISGAHGTFTAIDVTIASNCLAPRLFWESSKDTGGSDHIFSSTYLDTAITTKKKPRRWLYHNADWSAFQMDFDNSLEQNANYSIENLSNKLLEAAEKSIPRTSGNVGGKAMIWWNNTVEEAVKKRRKALRKLKKLSVENTNRPHALKDFQLVRAFARKTFCDAKTDSWKKFCESFTPNTSSKEMWENYGRLCGKTKKIDVTLVIDGEHISDPVAVADILADKLVLISLKLS